MFNVLKIKFSLVLLIGILFFLGCKKTENNTPSTQNSNINNNAEQNNSSNNSFNPSDSNDNIGFEDKTEHYKIYAERNLNIDINVPFSVISRMVWKKSPKHNAHGVLIDIKNKKIRYFPEYGYLGEDEMKIEFYDKHDSKNSIIITYKINIEKPLLEGNRDFTISGYCDDISNHLNNRSYADSFDIDIVDNDLNLLQKIYDDKKLSNGFREPKYSRITTDYYTPWYSFNNRDFIDEESIEHHNIFKNNFDNNVRISCNYPKGYFSLIYPIEYKGDWYAIKPYKQDYTFSRNDLFFYVSSLSELHRKIYFKEYQHTQNFEIAFRNASKFMTKAFPNSHYTGELVHNYSHETGKWNAIQYGKKFNEDNKKYYAQIQYLANKITNGDIPTLLEQIANNYESYYLSENKICLNETICGTLFPEYTHSVTTNAKFSNSDFNLEPWIERNKLSFPASGKIELFPTQDVVNIEFNADIPNSSESLESSLELYQTEILSNSSIDDYFLRFNLSEAYGGASGIFSGYTSSGFAGVYACYMNSNNENIGCLAWSDHTNKFDIAWGPAKHRIESSKSFYNTRLNNVIRRIRPNAKQFLFTMHLGELTKKYLPEIYNRRNKIKSIEYGLFATEFKNKEGGCSRCEAKIKANEINLLKK